MTGGKIDPARVLALLRLRLRCPGGLRSLAFFAAGRRCGRCCLPAKGPFCQTRHTVRLQQFPKRSGFGTCTTSAVPGIGAPSWWLPWNSSACTASSWNPSFTPYLMASTRRLRTFISLFFSHQFKFPPQAPDALHADLRSRIHAELDRRH